MFKQILFLASAISLLTACNPYQQLLKSTDYDLKFAKAKQYYNEGDYEKTIPIFEELMTIWRGTKNVEDIYYHYAYSHYCMGDYVAAAHHFKSFADNYLKNPNAEDARFMTAACYYEMSPPVSLDQTDTEKALESLQIFANSYPNSTKLAKCDSLSELLRRKIELKAYNAAYLYYKIRSYKAATTAFKDLLRDYPDSPLREEALFYTVKSYYLLAENSISDKQHERYSLAAQNYLDFIDSYPNSKYRREAEKIYIDCTAFLNLSKK
jgi:outer membrane protein assembly factor BamD